VDAAAARLGVMFTGIVEETGRVQRMAPRPDGFRLEISLQKCARGLKIGDSLAINGCCLSVVQLAGRGARRSAHFDLLAETWERTNLRFTKTGGLVNLERPLKIGGRLDGHFVSGHIDGLGRITRWETVGRDHVLEISAAKEVLRYVVQKGSIAIDGMSLTVAEVKARYFRVWIIPQTLRVTNLRERVKGDALNLECDLIGKYVERFATFAKV
jgi:riboflavin synthase